ncbi:hypothetical protein L2E82_08300 [Cichorium intybus]|uniref:Uncharacterized protein n=1 Tax=Cichorium intybus TaxID=13427 RepID=A0ACB9G6S8_CICIN|nr:hypothetical protein L2E82_08300 [Cichorium intybus]
MQVMQLQTCERRSPSLLWYWVVLVSLLLVSNFFFAMIPWYIGAFILLCAGYDDREKPGYVACVIAMQQEIKDLTNERDVPRTRLEEILRVAGM